MCGGFSIISRQKTLIKRFKAEMDFELGPNYNARPGQKAPVILASDLEKYRDLSAHRLIKLGRFGYLPHWISRPAALHAPPQSPPVKSPKPVINARAETLSAKPFFKDSFLHRRCLILADSFFEWKTSVQGKQPYRILLESEEPFAFAGIWDELPGDQIPGPAFAIITVPASRDVSAIHERMPAILLPEEEDLWLNPGLSHAQAQKLLHPYPDGLIKSYPVSRLVNSPINNSPELILPLTKKSL